MNLFKKLFGKKEKTEDSENSSDKSSYIPSDDAPIDEKFTYMFNKNGGKFLYCLSMDEIFEAFQNILEENQISEKDVYCINRRLGSKFNSTNFNFKEPKNNSFFLTTCESLIAKNGSILFSSNQIKGSGRGGRITKEDVVKAVPSMGTQPDWGERSQNRSKLSMLRRKVAERLVDAKNETAMLTTFNEVDMSEVFKVRNKFKDDFLKKHNVKLGFMSFFTKAVVRSLKLYPDVNSMMDGDYKISYDYCDISVAVSGPKGLMVPVVRNAEILSFSGIEKEIGRLAIKARDGMITVDDMTGGTFTISNGGVFGSMLSTPIINPPQSGILGMHNIIQRPVAINDKVEIRPMMYLALSYDHRIIDGKESVGFLVSIKEALEDPVELLMDNNSKQAFGL